MSRRLRELRPISTLDRVYAYDGIVGESVEAVFDSGIELSRRQWQVDEIGGHIKITIPNPGPLLALIRYL